MTFGGGPSIPLYAVLGRLLCFSLGMPFLPQFAVFAALCAVAVFARGLQLLRREGDDSWVFFSMAIVGAPLILVLPLALAEGAFVYERYFFLPLLFFLVLSCYVFADLMRCGPVCRTVAVVVLALIVAGNSWKISEFINDGGRGRFAEALRYIDAHDSDSDVTITSELRDIRVQKMLAFYDPYVHPGRSFRYDEQRNRATWLIVQRPDRDREPGTEFRFPDKNGALFRRAEAFRVTAFGGWDWYVYRRVVVSP